MFKSKFTYSGLDRKKLETDFEQAAMEVMQKVQIDARRVLKIVVGTQYASLSQLRADGHPYGILTVSKPRGPMPMPAGYVNSQSNEFFESFEWESPRKRGNSVILEVQAGDPDLEQILINGTPRMVARPYKTVFGKLLRDTVINKMPNAFRKAVRVRLQLSR